MSAKADKIRIIEPSKEVFEKIEEYKCLVASILPKAKITLIGAFAIPMCGKEEFDLLVEVDDIKQAQDTIKEKASDTFGIGPIIKGKGFCRSRRELGIICELHIAKRGEAGHYAILTEKFRSDPDLVHRYEELKRSLDGTDESYYKEKKREFLKREGLI